MSGTQWYVVELLKIMVLLFSCCKLVLLHWLQCNYADSCKLEIWPYVSAFASNYHKHAEICADNEDFWSKHTMHFIQQETLQKATKLPKTIEDGFEETWQITNG